MGLLQIVVFCFALLGTCYGEELTTAAQFNHTLTARSSCSCSDLSNLHNVVAAIQERLDVLEGLHKNTTCEEVWKSGVTESGVYTIYPFHDRNKPIDVYCDFTIDLPGWMTFQRRVDGSENFYLYWNDYVKGFGDKNNEFWLGLETLHQLTSERMYELRVDMEDFEGQTRFAKYSSFKVGEGTGYTIQVSGYSGNAGDCMANTNGTKFSTRNKDQDLSSSSCASLYNGAWWYRYCHYTNPNGLYLAGPHHSYADGVEWKTWHGYYYSLKRIELKIRLK